MPSVGRLIPVSGGFQNSAVRVSRAGPLLTCQPAPALMRRETRSWREINQDPNRSPPSCCVMMVLNPYGWKPDRSWLASLGTVDGWYQRACTHTRTPTRIACHLEYDAGPHGSIGSMAPHAIDGAGIMTCRARGTAKGGRQDGDRPGDGISSTGSSPLLPSGLHNSSSCEIEPKAPSHLHGRLWSPWSICQPVCCHWLCSRLIAIAGVLSNDIESPASSCWKSFRDSKEHRSS